MIVDKANNFITALASNNCPADSPATPKAVLMVEPEGFYVGEEIIGLRTRDCVAELTMRLHWMNWKKQAAVCRCMVAKIF